MRLFQRASDGGKKSGVTGFWFIEIKSLFSIVLLKFNPGTRENYHSHAFNALTLWLWGDVTEESIIGQSDDGSPAIQHKGWPKSGRFKWTPRRNIHRVIAHRSTWCLSIRGPWHRTWQEYDPRTREIITLTHGRVEVGRILAGPYA